MPTYANEDEAIGHEVPIKDLKIGQKFEEYLTGRVIIGMLIDKSDCSTRVWLDKTKKRVIRTGTGDEREISTTGELTRMQPQTPVVPLNEFVDVKEFLKESPSRSTTKAVNSEGKGDEMAPKKKAPKKVKELVITRYVTAKTDTEKGKALLANTKQRGLIFNLINDNPNSTFEELMGKLDKRTFKSASKNLESIVRWLIQDLRNSGFVKSADHKEEVPAAA